MSDLSNNIRYLLEALRTAPSPAHTTSASGDTRPTSNPNLGPIEQRRDGYRQYLNEFRGGSQEGSPMSYEEWISQEK